MAVYFAVSALISFFPPEAIRSDYKRWGYPDGFHLVTAALLAISAALLLTPAAAVYGALLASLVMAAALATVLYHREYLHAIPSAITLIVLGAFFVLR